MQITICDPNGKGKTGKGKKGGTYYIDLYSEISTDYFSYLNKRKLIDHITTINLDGTYVKTLTKEIELSIIMFHNVFPERTFQLEHFYIPLYYFKSKSFNYNVFVKIY